MGSCLAILRNKIYIFNIISLLSCCRYVNQDLSLFSFQKDVWINDAVMTKVNSKADTILTMGAWCGTNQGSLAADGYSRRGSRLQFRRCCIVTTVTSDVLLIKSCRIRVYPLFSWCFIFCACQTANQVSTVSQLWALPPPGQPWSSAPKSQPLRPRQAT